MLFLILHLIVLPIAIMAALANGLVYIALVDLAVFLMLFAVERVMMGKSVVERPEPRPRVRRVAAVQQ